MSDNTTMATPVGIEKLYVAFLSSDAAGGISYGTPQYFSDIQKLAMKPKTSSSPLYTEGRLKRNQIDFESIDVGVTIAQLTSAHKAALLGQTLAAAGGVYMTQEDSAPYVAILYKAPIVGGYRYGVIYKGRFAPYDEELAQKEGKTTYGVPVLAATFLPTDYIDSNSHHLVEYHVDTIDANCPVGIDTSWFTAVTVPGADTTAPTVTVVPADAATAVVASSSIVWTFSEAIDPSDITADNFMLIKSTDGTIVAADAPTLDTTGKIVTFKPTANLTSAGVYIATASTAVSDLAGNKLAAASHSRFTVA